MSGKPGLYAALIIIFFAAPGTLYSMPPHPDLIEKYRDRGQAEALVKRLSSSLTVYRSSAVPGRAPSSGAVRIPVLLVQYGTPFDGASAVLPSGYTFPGHLPFSAAGAAASVLFLAFLVLAYAGKSFRPAMLMQFLFFAALISCGVEAEDDSGTFQTDVSVYESLLNSSGSSDISVKNYYKDMSNGNLDLEFDIYGPVQVQKSWDYYGNNDASGLDSHPGELVGEAVKLMVAKYTHSVDFSIYDNDNDGNVDSVVIIHEGPGEEKSGIADTIWSHQWDLWSASVYSDGTGPVRADGVWINAYTIQPEYVSTRGDSTIGVFVHEFGHILGLPDLYDTGLATNGVGDFSVMGTGSWGSSGDGSDPAPLLAWERYSIGSSSWVTVTDITSANDGALTIDDIGTSDSVYRIVLDSTSGQEQYLFLEGKKAASVTGWYVPGSGILATHIHTGVWDTFLSGNEVNTGDARVHGVNIVEADGGGELWAAADQGSAGDLFDAGDSLADGTSPNTKYYTDNTNYTLIKNGSSGVSITGISSGASFPMDLTITVP